MATAKHDTWFDKERVKPAESDTELIQRISDWYDTCQTTVNTRTLYLWSHLSRIAAIEAERLLLKYNVKAELVSGQPYQTEAEMFSDIANGRLLVSTENTLHPIQGTLETYIGRIWHDMTHFEIQSNFSFQGECKTYHAQVNHARMFHPEFAATIRHTLFLDIVCQVASGSVYKQFPVQKTF